MALKQSLDEVTSEDADESEPLPATWTCVVSIQSAKIIGEVIKEFEVCLYIYVYGYAYVSMSVSMSISTKLSICGYVCFQYQLLLKNYDYDRLFMYFQCTLMD